MWTYTFYSSFTTTYTDYSLTSALTSFPAFLAATPVTGFLSFGGLSPVLGLFCTGLFNRWVEGALCSPLWSTFSWLLCSFFYSCFTCPSESSLTLVPGAFFSWSELLLFITSLEFRFTPGVGVGFAFTSLLAGSK